MTPAREVRPLTAEEASRGPCDAIIDALELTEKALDAERAKVAELERERDEARKALDTAYCGNEPMTCGGECLVHASERGARVEGVRLGIEAAATAAGTIKGIFTPNEARRFMPQAIRALDAEKIAEGKP